MKFTLSWLSDHLDTTASLDAISAKLTAIGLEVEELSDRAAMLKDFIVAEIQAAEPHPNANKLRVCKVSDGTEVRQIVCGAANARAGIKVVLAREGVFIPGSGITIKKTKIRDVESNGMLCSAEELGLEGSSEGIIELPGSSIPGAPAAPALGVDDPVIDINITPNRPDCLGARGIARDLAAAGMGTLKPLEIPALKHGAPSPVSVNIATPHCALFIGCIIKGVKNGPSPAWLQARLSAIGLRPISALVDITNYLMFEYGRPLHVFDAAKLEGDITVRSATHGETLKGLNGKEYTLQPGMTVIADNARALAIGGILGGEESGCTEATTDVFLEVALFGPENIAATGRTLDILSDARYRFERGVDPAFAETGAKLAVALIQQLCGGEASAFVTAGDAPQWHRTLPFRVARVESLGGVAVTEAQCTRILESLGFGIEANGAEWQITPPSWRRDVEGEADIVEEILRINGYDAIPATPLPKPATVSRPALNTLQKRVSLAKRLLATRGMLEVCSWSFIPQAQAALFGWSNEALTLLNPISADLDTMRPSLLPNLLSAVQKNRYRSLHDLSLFEVGVQFSGIAPEQQEMAASGIRTGQVQEAEYATQPYRQTLRDVDAYDAKADALALLETLGINPAQITITPNAPPWYHPGRSGTLTLGGKIILGHFGALNPRFAAPFDVSDVPVAAFELLLDAIPQPKSKGKAKPMLAASAFQPVERDFAFVVDAGITAAIMTRALEKVNKDLITAVRIFDVYSGKGMEAGKKSVAVKVTLQAADRTLTDAEISAVVEGIIAASGQFGGVLRQ